MSHISYEYNNRDKCFTLIVPGDILSTNVESLKEEIWNLFENKEVWREDWKVFMMDLSKANMIDSLGLNLIVSLIKRVKSRPSDMKIKVTNRLIKQTFLAVRLDRQVDLVD